MTLLPVLLLATTMAIFGTLGYLKGSQWAFISLLILLLAFIAIKVAPDQIVSLLNGLYMGVMLTLNGGLGAIASGDLDAAKETLSSIDKPFTGENENFALLLVILGAVGLACLLYLIMKKNEAERVRLDLGVDLRLCADGGGIAAGDEHSSPPKYPCRSFNPPSAADRSHNKPKAGRINFSRPCRHRRISRF